MPEFVSAIAALFAGATTFAVFAGRIFCKDTLGVTAGCALIATVVAAVLALAISVPESIELEPIHKQSVDKWRFMSALWPTQILGYFLGGLAAAISLKTKGLPAMCRDICAAPEAEAPRLALIAMSMFVCTAMILSIGSAAAIVARPEFGFRHTLGSIAFVSFGFMFWTGVLSQAVKSDRREKDTTPPEPAPPA